MAADSIHFTDNNAITQGITFYKTLLWPGDLTSYTPRAVIRDNRKEDAGAVMATFAFLPMTYPVLDDTGTECTQITIVLPASASAASVLDYTKYQGEPALLKIGKDVKGRSNIYVWNLELENSLGEVKGTNIGWVQVKPEAT